LTNPTEVVEQPINKEIKPKIDNSKYTFKEFAVENKGKKVKIQYDKYKTPFEATITGEVEDISTGSDEGGEFSYVGVQVKSNTGKLLTANPFYEIEGNIINKDKLTNDSNKIYKTQEQPIVEKTQSVVKEEIPNDISNMTKEDTQFESLQYAIGMYLADKNDTSKTTITENVNSFEEYSKNPVNVSKESWERMTREDQLAHWYANQKCRQT
jgi:hypothetical protein